MKYLLYAPLLTLTVLLVSAGALAHAQGNEDKTGEGGQISSSEPVSTEGAVIRLATVNIYDAQIVKENGAEYTIEFRLNNREGYQSGVKYAIQLLSKNDGGHTLIDEMVYEDTLTLSEFSDTPITVTYTPRVSIAGKYDLLVVARNNKGMPLGRAPLGTVDILGNGGGLQILQDTCFLLITGESGTPQYSLRQGVDVASHEDIQLRCGVWNSSKDAIQAQPSFRTHFRSVYGEVVPTESVPTEPISFSPLSTTTISLNLPIAVTPQSYDVVTELRSEGGVSNNVTTHYVLRGQSATVQTLTLDKSLYEAGERAQLTFFWSGSADSFDGARNENNSPNPKAFEAVLSDGNNASCAESVRRDLDESMQQRVEFAVTEECVDPHVQVRLVNGDGTMLDEGKLALTSVKETPIAEEEPPSPETNKRTSLWILVCGVAFLLMGGVYVVAVRTRKPQGDMIPPSSGVMMLFLALSFGISALAPAEAQADTFVPTNTIYQIVTESDEDGWLYQQVPSCAGFSENPKPLDSIGLPVLTHECIPTNIPGPYMFTVNLDSTAYYGFFDIEAFGSVEDSSSGNPPGFRSVLSVTIAGTKYTIFDDAGIGPAIPSGIATGQAPSTPGNYQALFEGTIYGGQTYTGSYGIPYQVKTNGECPFPSVHYTCKKGTSANQVEEATQWKWNCNGAYGGTNVSCTENRPVTITGRCSSPSTHYTCDEGTPVLWGYTATNYVWTCQGSGAGTSEDCFEPRPPADRIEATPEVCTVNVGESTCATTISWQSTNNTNPIVRYLSNGVDYAGGSAAGSFVANWIKPEDPLSGFQLFNGSTFINGVMAGAKCDPQSKWNNSICEALPPGTPWGEIKANPVTCIVPLNGSQCQSRITWTVSPEVINPEVNIAGDDFMNANGYWDLDVTPPETQFIRTATLLNGNGTVLDFVVVTAECAEGSEWDTGKCRLMGPTSAPTVTLDACDLGGANCVSGPGTKSIVTGNNIEIKWSSVGALACTKTAGAPDFVVSGTSGTDNTITEPTMGTSMVFTVACGNTTGTTTKSVTIDMAGPVPPIPTNLQAGQTCGGQAVDLAWTASPGATSSDLEIDGSAIINVGTANTYTHTGLTLNSAHTYRVRGVNSNGVSAWTNPPVNITTASVCGIPTVTLTASSINPTYNSAVTLTWTVTGAVTSCTATGDWSGSKNINGGIEVTGNLTAPTTYNLQCTNGGIDSLIHSVTVTPQPWGRIWADPSVLNTDGGTVEINWEVKNTDACDIIPLAWGGGAESPWFKIDISGTQSSTTAPLLYALAPYTYSLKCTNLYDFVDIPINAIFNIGFTAPTLTADKRVVRLPDPDVSPDPEKVILTWDTGSENFSDCSITGTNGYTLDPLTSQTGDTPSISILAQTTFILQCDILSAVRSVGVTPSAWEN